MTPQQFPDLIDTDAMAGLLDSQDNFFLSADDLFTVAESVATRRLKPLNKTQRVYAALRSIGRPAHYSEVTKAYNSNFPDDQTSQRNILAMLSRCAAPDLEQYGLVWTGAKGVYALKVWGYERPSKGLFDAVTEIVNERYKETGKPVPLVVITAEVGKYRQVVPPSSLIFATHRNPNLRRVSEDTFVPEGGCDEMREGDKQDDLDRILRAFERRS